jgi:hypothetical protein
MNAGLHAVSWTAQRLAVVIGLAVFVALFAYAALVFVMVAIQAAGSFAGQ